MKKYLPLLILLSLMSCKTIQYVPVTEYRDSIHLVTKYDSIRFVERDSIYIREKKDTVFVERWKTIIKERFRDRTDTVKVTEIQEIPVPVNVEIPAELNKWQKTQLRGFWLFLLVGVVYIAIKFKTPLKGFIQALIKIFIK